MIRKQIKKRNNNDKTDYAAIARQLWIDVLVAVAGSDNCTQKAHPAHWADKAVVDFLERVKDDAIS